MKEAVLNKEMLLQTRVEKLMTEELATKYMRSLAVNPCCFLSCRRLAGDKSHILRFAFVRKIASQYLSAQPSPLQDLAHVGRKTGV